MQSRNWFVSGVNSLIRRLGAGPRLKSVVGYYPFSRNGNAYRANLGAKETNFSNFRRWDFRKLWAKGALRSHQVSRKH
jgi:hypothetical protein